ncbi:MAG: hypothetical protein WEC15_00950 [Flavobacteriales bacterium]
MFRTYLVREEAEALAEKLVHLGLHAEFEDNSSAQDPLFSGSVLPSFHVLLPTSEFEHAQEMLREDTKGFLEELPSDHYLHEFSDAELMDVLLRPEEWSIEDVSSAQQILGRRGKVVPDELIAAARATRIQDLREPAPPQTAFIVLGYVSALLGGLLGIAIGWYINTAMKTLPNGERVPVYRVEDRRHAARLFALGVIVALILLTYRVVVILIR